MDYKTEWKWIFMKYYFATDDQEIKFAIVMEL